jgi:hypothetical protein
MSQDDTNKNNEVEEDKSFGLKDPNSLSAFEVYSTRRHQQSNHSSINNAKRKAVTNTISNPVRLVREAAIKFGLTVLSSELDKIRYPVDVTNKNGSYNLILHLDCFRLCVAVCL